MSLESFEIQPARARRLSRDHDEGWNVLSDSRPHGTESVAADGAKLVHEGKSAQDGMVADGDVAGEGRIFEPGSEEHWKWRHAMAALIAKRLNMERFGVEALYVIGSTKNATAGPASDIDLLVHFTGNVGQRRCLESWFEGWSLCLSEMNRHKTGCQTEGLLDIHIVTDQDIQKRTSFSIMIGAVDDPASLLRRKGGEPLLGRRRV